MNAKQSNALIKAYKPPLTAVAASLKALEKTANITVDIDDSLNDKDWPSFQVCVIDNQAKDNRGRWFELWFSPYDNQDGEIVVTAYAGEDTEQAQEGHYSPLAALHGLLGMLLGFRKGDETLTAPRAYTPKMYAEMYAELEKLDDDLTPEHDWEWTQH